MLSVNGTLQISNFLLFNIVLQSHRHAGIWPFHQWSIFLSLQNPFHNDKFGAMVCCFQMVLSNHHNSHSRSKPGVDLPLNHTLGTLVSADCHRLRMELSLDEHQSLIDPYWFLHIEYNRNGVMALAMVLVILHLLHFDLR